MAKEEEERRAAAEARAGVGAKAGNDSKEGSEANAEIKTEGKIGAEASAEVDTDARSDAAVAQGKKMQLPGGDRSALGIGEAGDPGDKGVEGYIQMPYDYR